MICFTCAQAPSFRLLFFLKSGVSKPGDQSQRDYKQEEWKAAGGNTTTYTLKQRLSKISFWCYGN